MKIDKKKYTKILHLLILTKPCINSKKKYRVLPEGRGASGPSSVEGSASLEEELRSSSGLHGGRARPARGPPGPGELDGGRRRGRRCCARARREGVRPAALDARDRKSTRLNSSHAQ